MRRQSYFWVLIGILSALGVAVNDSNNNTFIITGAALVGAFTGWAFYKFILKRLVGYCKKISSQELLIVCTGLLFGLLLQVFFSIIFSTLLEFVPFGKKIGFNLIMLIVFTGVSVSVASAKSKEIHGLLFHSSKSGNAKQLINGSQFKILDTSAIIDGRIADLCKTGFVEGILIVPNFVLGELQKIADSADSLRRNRGRRGLDLLNRMQKENQIIVKIFDRDYEGINEVDTKILKLAREMEAKVVTNDFNLNKVAELYGVQVLNINELSNAIKPLVLPGEEMVVHVLRDGKEYGQGIGYLEDGTMIVVEGGKNFIGLDIEILVTSVLQTSAGRMIFAKPKEVFMAKVTS